MRQINEIIIHCSATPEERDDKAKQIREWHMKERGFKDIGYHYVIDLDGTIEKGRSEDVIGAHCTNHNAHSIGICYIGGKTKDLKKAKDTRTDAQKASLLSLCQQLKKKYPAATIHGHSEFANKACPAFDVQAWRKEVNL